MSNKCAECQMYSGHVHGCSLNDIDVSADFLKSLPLLYTQLYAACKALEPSLRMYYCGNTTAITAFFDGVEYAMDVGPNDSPHHLIMSFIEGSPLYFRGDEIGRALPGQPTYGPLRADEVQSGPA